MLSLRLVRGGRPLVQARRLLVSAASAGTGFLLLAALGHALSHDGAASSVRHLAWCLVPLAATVYVAAAVSRTDPALRPERGRPPYGLSPRGLRLLAGTATAAFCALGSVVALLLFLLGRGSLGVRPLGDGAAKALGTGFGLPVAAVLTLLVLVPAATAVAAAALTPVPATPGTPPATSAPPGLPWGVALLAAGFAVRATLGEGTAGLSAKALAGRDGVPGGVVAGWALIAAGLAVAGPGITWLCGKLLQSGRPGAVRLLAGRGLQEEARRVGRPLGVAVAVGAALSAAYGGDATYRATGPLTALGVGLVVACAATALLLAAVESRQARTDTTAALAQSGTPVATLRTAVALRVGTVLVGLLPLTWAVAALATLPVGH
ncbi:hypothetical protein [Streptomyces sp. SPB074]|uniref:hypothetical protein n=1 Tax=Streptomyces sp. (strain SPB074) TaxID=465543 RepID=UPI00017FEC3A|nr:hypothetical protein [Streptomyces sp. SPB074]EDY44304.1 membrane protein [Streptomyces sp. SPB074]